MDNLAEMFMKFDYAEAKDLSKQFLTTVIAVLVFSVTFAEKVINFSQASRVSRWNLLGSWTCFLLAIMAGGIGLAYISWGAGGVVYGMRHDYLDIALATERWLTAGGVLFVLGLLLLIAGAANSMFLEARKLDIPPEPRPPVSATTE